jgi:hypothetical protein
VIVTKIDWRCVAVALFLLAGIAPNAAAQTDEIQVYDGKLADVGVVNLTWHNNYTPAGIQTPAFPGAVVADKSFNGVTEWAFGVTPWFEAGLYLPLYSHDQTSGWGIDGFKLRALFAVPHAADRTFFYGANFEFSVNADRWEGTRFSSEVRPIIGWHVKPVDIIINPIIDTSYDGLKNLEFVPAARIAYNLSEDWALAAEEYDNYGPVHQFLPASQQGHEIWAVVDYEWKKWELEPGVGFGLTNGSDKFTLKLIVSRDLNGK